MTMEELDTVVNGMEELTRQERVVTKLVIRGHTNGYIATHLEVSKQAIEGHLTHIYRKLNVDGRVQLMGHIIQRTH